MTTATTSAEAARSIKPCAATMRAQVLRYIAAQGVRGAIDEEIAAALGMNPSTARPRRLELLESGMIADAGWTRKTASGRSATVWVAQLQGLFAAGPT